MWLLLGAAMAQALSVWAQARASRDIRQAFR